MKAPSSYAEWVEALDLFRIGAQDDETLTAMEQGNLSWSSGVAERFVARLQETCDRRMQQLSERQRRNMQHASSERDVVNYLLTYRREFAKLHRLVSLRVLPDNVRVSLQDMVRNCAKQAQQSLEDAARQDRSGRLVVLVRNTRVEQY